MARFTCDAGIYLSVQVCACARGMLPKDLHPCCLRSLELLRAQVSWPSTQQPVQLAQLRSDSDLCTTLVVDCVLRNCSEMQDPSICTDYVLCGLFECWHSPPVSGVCEIHRAWPEWVASDGARSSVIMSALHDVLPDHILQLHKALSSAVNGSHTGCPGVCKATTPAFSALQAKCSSWHTCSAGTTVTRGRELGASAASAARAAGSVRPLHEHGSYAIHQPRLGLGFWHIPCARDWAAD